MVHDLVKIVVPYVVSEVKLPIPPDRSVHLSSYIGVLDDPLHAKASQKGLRLKKYVDQSPSVEVSNDTNPILSIDTTTSSSIDTHRASEWKEFEVCQNCFDGGTTTRSNNFGKRRGRIGRRGKGPRAVLDYH